MQCLMGWWGRYERERMMMIEDGGVLQEVCICKVCSDMDHGKNVAYLSINVTIIVRRVWKISHWNTLFRIYPDVVMGRR